MKNKTTLLATMVILAASLSRLLPHPPNFTAIGAMAFFSGCYVLDRRFAFLIPMGVMFVTDLLIGFHTGMIPVYLCVAFTAFLGLRLSGKPTFSSGLTSVLVGSLAFFLITNLPIFYPSLYPNTLEGLLQSYTAALPFFRNQLAGDLIYTGLLFLVFNLLKNKVLNLAN
ncbi:MAG: DUF6580 family putative transport protein [Bacteroidota bacterium]